MSATKSAIAMTVTAVSFRLNAAMTAELALRSDVPNKMLTYC